MCGILLEVSPPVSIISAAVEGSDDDNAKTQQTAEAKNLSRRGPDHLGSGSISIRQHDEQHRVTLQASVLKMRSHSTLQPVAVPLPDQGESTTSTEPGSNTVMMHLAWNGEVYQRIHNSDNNHDDTMRLESVAGYYVADTQLVADMLLQAHQQFIREEPHPPSDGNILDSASDSILSIKSNLDQYAACLANVFGQLVNAEYSFCLLTPWAVYYGRDPWGRRSLLSLGRPEQKQQKQQGGTSAHSTESTIIHQEQQNSHCVSGWKLVSVIEDNDSCMAESIKDPVWNEVTPGVLHEYRLESGTFHSTPIQYPIICVPPLVSLSSLPPMDTSSYGKVTPSMWKASLGLEHWLREAVRLRVSYESTAQPIATTLPDTAPSSASPYVAVLFSGGIDSVVLAALTLQVLPTTEPLRLWNVSFVNEHSSSSTSTTPSTAQDCRAALASYEELKQLFPHHKIVLETTEVTWEEMTRWEAHIRTLIHPKTTIMDLNIGMALWFASRGRGCGEEDRRPAEPRILLVGMGADEQLGGYGRHRKAFERAMKDGKTIQQGGNGNDSKTTSVDQQQPSDHERALSCLREELDLDICRLWERNLGRDDRVFSDHGKEARFPYLDFQVMNFLKQKPLDDICDFSLPPGQGDKRILRLVAMRLGLKTASGMVKRAIQFGSRVAHVSDKKRFGSRRKAHGTAVA